MSSSFLFHPIVAARIFLASVVLLSAHELFDEDFTYHISRSVKVVLWTTYINYKPEWIQSHAPDCHVERAYSKFDTGDSLVTDPDHDISDADVVVFNLAVLEIHNKVLPRVKRPGQLWVATCTEPTDMEGGDVLGDCSLIHDSEVMSRMDAVASYDLNSTFPNLFTPPPEEVMRRPAPDFRMNGTKPDLSTGHKEIQRATASSLATFTSSHCVDWRRNWAANVSTALQVLGGSRTGAGPAVLNYGKCLKNAEEKYCPGVDATLVPEHPGRDVARKVSACTSAERIEQPSADEVFDDELLWFTNRCCARPFQLVAENSPKVPWYITEKLWNSLASGAVPVYYGPPEVKQLLPEGAVLFASDFASPEDLAKAVLSLDLQAAHAWKTRPTSEWGLWAHARRLSRFTLLPRLCEAASELWPEGLAGPPAMTLAEVAARQKDGTSKSGGRTSSAEPRSFFFRSSSSSSSMAAISEQLENSKEAFATTSQRIVGQQLRSSAVILGTTF